MVFMHGELGGGSIFFITSMWNIVDNGLSYQEKGPDFVSHKPAQASTGPD